MAAKSRAGCDLPLDNDFDFDKYMARPADISPPSSLELDDINAENCVREKKNKVSRRLTRAYIEAKNDGSLTNEDVGEPLLPFYQYKEEDLRLMVADRDICASVGPLSQYIILWLGTERMKTQASRESEKEKRRLSAPRASGEDQGSVSHFWYPHLSQPALHVVF
ncbi:hypothetical protein B0H13DRAFT_2501579 [Mycena leptocephala]|nr:hypothetical protein B0H13DRAFT_2501579 [Mycena leptocephala]